jgi:hypothetical protein
MKAWLGRQWCGQQPSLKLEISKILYFWQKKLFRPGATMKIKDSKVAPPGMGWKICANKDAVT